MRDYTCSQSAQRKNWESEPAPSSPRPLVPPDTIPRNSRSRLSRSLPITPEGTRIRLARRLGERRPFSRPHASSAPDKPSSDPMTRDSLREICAFIVIGLGAFLIVCVFSHDPLDYLADRHADITNAGGRVGAAIAHTTIHWVGKAGAYGLAIILALLGIVLFFRRRVEQWGWKLAGGALFVVILSCYEVAVFDYAGGADSLAGGLYGDFFYRSLLEHLSTFGTHLILLLATLVAFILATDTLIYPALARSQEVIANAARWERLVGFVGDRVRSPAAVARLRSFLTLGRGRRSRRGKPAKSPRKRRAPVRTSKPKKPAAAAQAEATAESDLNESDVAAGATESAEAETQSSSRRKPSAVADASGPERDEEPEDLEEEEGEDEELEEDEGDE